MNYRRVYDEIITNRLENPIQGYVERHHILPRSLGGTDDSDNIVCLSAREHFICHWLLVKIYPTGTEHMKMAFALNMMLRGLDRKNGGRHIPKSHFYEYNKKRLSEACSKRSSGKKWFSCHVLKESNLFRPGEEPLGWVLGRDYSGTKGTKRSQETKDKMSKARKGQHAGEKNPMYGRTFSEEVRKAISKRRKGSKHSDETRTKMKEAAALRKQDPEDKERRSKSQKNRRRGSYPHCNKEMDLCNLKKYHLDNCKSQSSSAYSGFDS